VIGVLDPCGDLGQIVCIVPSGRLALSFLPGVPSHSRYFFVSEVRG